MRIEPIKEYKHDFNGVRNFLGPTQSLTHTSFTPCPVDTAQVNRATHSLSNIVFNSCLQITLYYQHLQIVLPPHLERIREKLAENIHELWAVTRIEQGWIYGVVSDSFKRYSTHKLKIDSERL